MCCLLLYLDCGYNVHVSRCVRSKCDVDNKYRYSCNTFISCLLYGVCSCIFIVFGDVLSPYIAFISKIVCASALVPLRVFRRKKPTKSISLFVQISDVRIRTPRIRIRIQTPRIQIQTNSNPDESGFACLMSESESKSKSS